MSAFDTGDSVDAVLPSICCLNLVGQWGDAFVKLYGCALWC